MAADGGAEALALWIGRAREITAFTGAGISRECGIPDFRSKDSAWKRYPPMPLGDFLAGEENQCEAWLRKFAMDDLYAGAKPGRVHLALAGLMSAGKLNSIITQNIDGLHTDAGAPLGKIIELHGNGRAALCLTCGVRLELRPIRERFETTGRAPRCLCGGIVKSATISFGQKMPPVEMRQARDASLACDLFIALGSSLVVYPAAGFPLMARENGARLVIVNNEATPLDALADLTVRGDAGALMAPFISGAV